jgi:hypothetical protein
MKKLFLLLAFTGIVAASSASTIVSLTKANVTLGEEKKGDDKKKKEEKKSCDKDHACCKKDAKATGGTAEAKTCSHDGKEGKSCCKKTEASATTTEKK